MKVDILAFGAHPDDVELGCSGTIIQHVRQGKKVGIVDLTLGELGTKGTVQTRKEEAAIALKILGASFRENLELPDGFLSEDEKSLKIIISSIRKYQPEIVFCNAMHDRHPDHGIAGKLISRACFLSGLIKIDTEQEAWRPKAVYHYIQDRYIQPDFVVDITNVFEERMNAVKAFKTQFYNPDDKGPSTAISTKEFLDVVKGRLMDHGRLINCTYGEGFTTERPIGADNIFNFI